MLSRLFRKYSYILLRGRYWNECPDGHIGGFIETFCGDCGKKTIKVKIQHCPKCGKEIIHSYCPKCGRDNSELV